MSGQRKDSTTPLGGRHTGLPAAEAYVLALAATLLVTDEAANGLEIGAPAVVLAAVGRIALDRVREREHGLPLRNPLVAGVLALAVVVGVLIGFTRPF